MSHYSLLESYKVWLELLNLPLRLLDFDSSPDLLTQYSSSESEAIAVAVDISIITRPSVDKVNCFAIEQTRSGDDK